MAKVSPEFSMILPCPSDLGTSRGREGAAAGRGSTAPAPGPGPGEGLQGASTSHVGAAALPSAVGDCRGMLLG